MNLNFVVIISICEQAIIFVASIVKYSLPKNLSEKYLDWASNVPD